MTPSIRIRKSPALLARNVVFLQFAALIAYFSISTFADYGSYYNKYLFAGALSYQIARFVFFLGIEALLLVYVFLRWFLGAYIVYPSLFIDERGVIFRRRISRELFLPIDVSSHDGFLEKHFRFGTIVIRDAGKRKPIFLTYVSDPAVYVKKIKSLHGEVARATVDTEVDFSALLQNREDEKLEFKSSFRWDMRAGKVNRAIEKAALKTITAFLNSDGGHLVIGMADNGDPAGLEHDYATLQRPDADGFENHFTNIFKASIGPEFRSYAKLSFHKNNGKDVCVVRVFPSDRPAYLKFDNEESFYIRTGNSTTALPVSQAMQYIRSRWDGE